MPEARQSLRRLHFSAQNSAEISLHELTLSLINTVFEIEFAGPPLVLAVKSFILDKLLFCPSVYHRTEMSVIRLKSSTKTELSSCRKMMHLLWTAPSLREDQGLSL